MQGYFVSVNLTIIDNIQIYHTRTMTPCKSPTSKTSTATLELMYGESADVVGTQLDAQHSLEVKASAQLKPSVRQVRKLLYRRLRVGVKDGRIFVGKFHCLDKQGNIILYDTVEHRLMPAPLSPSASTEPDPATELRSLGLVLIPSHCRTSCHVECSIDEEFSLLSLKDTEGGNDFSK